MAAKVEVVFDLSESENPPFLQLDDNVAGRLDDPDFTLAGAVDVDITEFVENISISRGKSRLLDRFQAGRLSVTLDNTSRAFDPTFTSSPFIGNIIPRREVRVTVDDEVQFFGVIDDYNLDYNPVGKQFATLIASDGFTRLTNQTLTGGLQTEQTSGERVDAILNDLNVDWPLDKRDIDGGDQILGADTIEAGTDALSYLQLIEKTELGKLFIGKDGQIVFRDRTVAPTSTGLISLSDEAGGVPFQSVSVEFGSELLFNQVTVGSKITGNQVTLNDLNSQAKFGVISLEQTELLMSTDEAAEDLAKFLLTLFNEPEFRFREISVKLEDLTSAQKAQVLALEMDNVVEIKFTPGAVGDPILKYGDIIGISHSISPSAHVVRFAFATTDTTTLVLDDAAFGKLNQAYLGTRNEQWTLGDPIKGRLSAGMTLG